MTINNEIATTIGGLREILAECPDDMPIACEDSKENLGADQVVVNTEDDDGTLKVVFDFNEWRVKK